jgi:L-ascorbate metabolism protein UlaG (beta-lactamase superfamily)
MLRWFAVVVVALLVAPWAVPQDGKKDDPKKDDPKKDKVVPPGIPGKLTISWHGQSFFSLVTPDGKVFVFDPHNIMEYNRAGDGLRPDVIMLSHEHNDHTQIGIFENVSDKASKNPPKIIRGLKKGEDGRETWNILDKPLEIHGAKISTVGAFHDDQRGMKSGKITIFIVEIDGWRIVHLGDLGHKLEKAQLEALIGTEKDKKTVDVLMIPCGGIYGLNGSEARVVLNQIKPKEFVLPMHIGTYRYDDLLPVDEFVDGNPLPCAIVRDYKLIYNKEPGKNPEWVRTNSLKGDNMLILERDPARKGPVIVNLHYWPQTDKKKG